MADQARMRSDLRELHLEDEIIAELRMLTAQRGDLAAERTRTINRLRQRLLGAFSGLERGFGLHQPGTVGVDQPVSDTGSDPRGRCRRTRIVAS